MLYIILLIVIAIFGILLLSLYIYTDKIFKKLDIMIDSAINDTFSESMFSEKKLSKLEAKMYQYLSAGKTSLRQINEEKNTIKTLIADISHQTKTPISNILLYSQLLSEAGELSENTRVLVSQLENQTENLNFLISSLVKISRLENGIVTVNPQKNSISELLGSIDLKNLAAKKGISVKIDNTLNAFAFFDFKWTLEAVSNIVDNAVKYTSSGGTVTVCAKEYEMFVCIDVIDTGIGISEEETAKIFTRFYRSSRVSDIQGVGIGLFLSREILSKEGGYIKVYSKINQGSTFSVFLPKNINLSKV